MTPFQHKARSILYTAVLSAGLASPLVSAQVAIMDAASPPADAAEPTGRLIIKYRSEEKPWQSPRGSRHFTRSEMRQQKNLRTARTLDARKELVTTRNTRIQSLRASATELSQHAEIEYASVEYHRYPLLQPNDTLYQDATDPGDQSYLFDGQYSLNAPGAWDITTGSSSSVIAIVDTGVLPAHPELADRSVAQLGYDFVSADSPGDFSSANDGDGRDANPVDPGDPCFAPSSWHGTAVTSAAAANSNNAEGLTGIDWNARTLHARALGICGGTDADIIDAVRWSAGLEVAGVPANPTPANVINLSLGGITECTPAWQEVVSELAARNVVIVMAAGNEANNALRLSPANCANVISVASSTPTGDLDSGFSNYGIKVTVATAGNRIVVASNTGNDASDPDGSSYRTETGTSFSAALVSGAVSLMHSLDPDLGPTEIKALFQQSATSFASGSSCDLIYCGPGILDLSRTLSMLRDGNYDPTLDLSKQLIQKQSTPIDLNQSTDTSLFGYKDIRYFSVDVSQRGLLQAESTGTGNLYGYLLNDKLSVLSLDNNNGDANNFRVASLVEPGTYYIAVERSTHRFRDGELPFGLSANLSTDEPDAFLFTTIDSATGNDFVNSNTVTISGLDEEAIITVSNGFYSKNGGELTFNTGTVNNGDSISLGVQSAAASGGLVSATVTVGAFSSTFNVITNDGEGNKGGNSGDAGSGCSIVPGRQAGVFDPLLLVISMTALAGLMRRRKVVLRQPYPHIRLR